MLNRRDFLKITGTALIMQGAGCSDQKIKQKPNIVFILADDLGYGDLSCYGQTKFQTPNIDRLAREGILFKAHYSGSTVCAPSRSALMTGQHTGHTPIRGNKEIQPEGQQPLPKSAVTVAELLKQAGYVTGAFGKWGLGFPGSEGDPNNQGFDEFFGYNCQRVAHHYYPWHLWHNQKKIVLEENRGTRQGLYAPELIHEEALEFIDKNQDKPFFLFVPSTIPHAELFAPEAYMKKYRGKFEPEKSYDGVDKGEHYRKGPYGSQPEAHAAFVAMIDLLDDQVGEIVDKIKKLGLSENTLIIFSSDNGPHLEGGADPTYFDSNGPLQGFKRDLYEGGIRVPMIACWQGQIDAGTTTEHVSAFWDFLPTVCDINSIKTPDNIDGISYLPTLLNVGEQRPHEFLYWEFHEGKATSQAVRMDKWKAVRKAPEEAIELYNLETDMGESTNVADEHPAVIDKIKQILETARTESKYWPLHKNE
jgi:arylsulfatase A-like enzyme